MGRAEETVRGEFLNTFGPRYQRNNKPSGHKNIRCFPCCSERGHMRSGFCGRFLRCSLSGLPQLRAGEVVRCWGEFVTCGGDQELLANSSKLKLAEVSQKERTRAEPLRAWVRGEITENAGGVVEVVFNRQLLGWHYDWVSTKHTCDAFHSFKAHVFVLNQRLGELTFVGSVMSPQFQLYSRRRQAQMKEVKRAEEEAAAAEALVHGLGPAPPAVKREHSAPSLSQPGPKRRQVFDSAQTRKRRKRNLILDRLLRFLLTHTGQGTNMAMVFEANDRGPAHSGQARVEQRAPGLAGPGSNAANANTQAFDGGLPDEFSVGLMSLVANDTGPSMGLTDEELDMLLDSTLADDNLPDDTDEGSSGLHSSPDQARYARGSGPAVSQAGAEMPPAVTRPARANSNDDVGVDLLSKLRGVVLAHGSPNVRARLDHLMATLTRLPDSIIMNSSNRRDFANFTRRWSSAQGIRALKAQFEEEQRSCKMLDGFVNEEEEEDDEEAGRSGARQHVAAPPGAFRSVYAEMRNMFRNVVLESMSSLSADLDEFEECMELAARHRLLNADPFYPPSKRVAAMTHLQLFGNLDQFKTQDFGSRRERFRNEVQRLEWVNAYWKLRRKVFRRLMVYRIMQEKQGSGMPTNAKPVDPRWDLSGTWFNCSSAVHSQLLKSLTKKVGMSMGDLSARLFETMYKRIEIKINQEAMHVQGEKVLLANPSSVFFLDKKARSFTLANPLPVSAWSLERRYVAWLSEGSCGRAFVNIVNGGATRAEHISKYYDNGGDQIRSSTPQEIKRNSQVRLARRYWISSDRETLFVSSRIHFFDEESAPSIESFAEAAALLQPGLPSQVGYYEFKYIRVYDDSADLPDDILALLEGDL